MGVVVDMALEQRMRLQSYELGTLVVLEATWVSVVVAVVAVCAFVHAVAVVACPAVAARGQQSRVVMVVLASEWRCSAVCSPDMVGPQRTQI